MKKLMLTLLILPFVSLVTKAQQPQNIPPTAGEILHTALQEAKQQHKKILIMFHASWCGWCKKMDASINDPDCKDYFDKNFVIDHITVMEHGDKVALDNPGGEEMLEKYGGGEQGIPYWLIFDENGNLLTNSRLSADGNNVGCPAQETEVAAFVALLKKYTSISDNEAKAIHDRFLKNAPASN